MADSAQAPDQKAPLVRQVTAGLFKLGMALRTHAWRDTTPRGLNPTQAQVLALLRASAEPLRLSAVAEGMAVTLPTASDAVKALTAKGLVAKTRSPDDARAVALSLTDAGRVAADAADSGPEFVLAAVNALNEDEQQMFVRALIKMVRTLQERGDIAPAKMCVSCRFFRPYAHPDDNKRPHHCTFVDAAFGDRALRIDCADHSAASDIVSNNNWQILVSNSADM